MREKADPKKGKKRIYLKNSGLPLDEFEDEFFARINSWDDSLRRIASKPAKSGLAHMHSIFTKEQELRKAMSKEMTKQAGRIRIFGWIRSVMRSI